MDFLDDTNYIDFTALQEFIGTTDIDSHKIYFREIYKDLLVRLPPEQKSKSDKQPYITKIIFAEYINLPIIIAEKLFNSFDQDKDGHLNLKEFSKNLVTLYTGTFEQICELIFNLLDFDSDGIIIPEDVKLLMQYLPLNMRNEYKWQMASLDEIDLIINQLFNTQMKLDLREFIYATENHHSDAFLQILCFLYERKPFTKKGIQYIKKKRNKYTSNNNITLNTNSLSTTSNNFLNISPKKTIRSPNRKSLLSPLRLLNKMDKTKTLMKCESNIFEHNSSFKLDESFHGSARNSSVNSDDVCLQQNLSSVSLNNSFSALNVNEQTKCFLESIHFEGEIYKVSHNGKLKEFFMVLTGKDLFYFNSHKMDELRGIHNLSGCSISKVKKSCENGKLFYMFTITFKYKHSKYYTKSEHSANTWHKLITQAIGGYCFSDFYKEIKELGKGKFGVVKLCENKTTKLKVAVKIISKEQMNDADKILLNNELEIMKLVSHPNIVSLIDLFETNDNIYIVMDFYKGGDLSSYIFKDDELISEKHLSRIIYQLSLGLKYIHQYGIVHRDLKTDNIMLSDNSRKPVVKIMDFGLSKILGAKETADEGYGTLVFVAPEVLMRQPYNKAIDIWGVGVITYYALAGVLPFDNENDDEEDIASQIVYADVEFPTKYWRHRSKEAIDFIRRCLIKEPERRITINEMLTHPWIVKYN
jgi:calcium/calmodulin-dependent protein kinase I